MELSGGPTKDEVMAISLFKLGLLEGDIFADIGCGTGKISIAVSHRASRIYAIDRRKEAIEIAREKAERTGIENIRFFHGEAVDFLQTIDQHWTVRSSGDLVTLNGCSGSFTRLVHDQLW